MKALSVRAPWSWWILEGGKDIENRGLRFPRRNVHERVLIHQSKWWNDDEVDWDNQEADSMYQKTHDHGIGLLGGIGEIREWCGCLVGSVEIVDYVTESDSPWFAGPLGIVVRNPIMLPELIPFKGMLGFFEVPDSIVRV